MADIRGTRGGDDLPGTDGDDEIRGLRGGDAIAGLDGADRLLAGGGRDDVRGGPGDDELRGGADGDFDTLLGGEGDDLFEYAAGGGRDLFTDFGRGSDQIYLAGEDRLHGFADLDSNGDGVLDDGDEDVAVGPATFADRVEESTIIDASALFGGTPGAGTITVLGDTGLVRDDFFF